MEKTSTTYGRENDGKNGTNSNFFICSCVIYLMLFYFFKFCCYSSVCLCARLRKGQAWVGGSPIVKMQGCPSSRFGASDRSKFWSDRGCSGRKSYYFYPYRYRLGLFIKNKPVYRRKTNQGLLWECIRWFSLLPSRVTLLASGDFTRALVFHSFYYHYRKWGITRSLRYSVVF